MQITKHEELKQQKLKTDLFPNYNDEASTTNASHSMLSTSNEQKEEESILFQRKLKRHKLKIQKKFDKILSEMKEQHRFEMNQVQRKFSELEKKYLEVEKNQMENDNLNISEIKNNGEKDNFLVDHSFSFY